MYRSLEAGCAAWNARNRGARAAILLALGLLTACGDVADDDPASHPTESPQSWQEHLERSDEGLVSKQLPGGGRVLDLRGRYQHAQVVSIEGGKPMLVCADRVPAVESILDRAEKRETQ